MNKPELTKNEFSVLDLLLEGNGKEGIASQLQVDMRTVERHLDRITTKFSEIDGSMGRTRSSNTDKEDLGTVGRITRMLKIYREHYLDQRPIFYVMRKSVRYEIEITEDYIFVETQVEIKSLLNQLTHVAHGLVLDDRTPQADASHIDLSASTENPHVRVVAERVITDPKKPRFRVNFDPPLAMGQSLIYEYSIKSANYFPMTIAEIKKRIDEGYYHLHEEVCETPYTISTTTGHLHVKLTFPRSFEVEKAYVTVEVGHSGPKSEEETQRAEEAFKIDRFKKQTSLILELEQPLLNHRYRIRWRPAK
jgi:Bacterial regulatory proteins, luxR family